MTTPTDEQIDQFAMVISDANCPGYAPCSDIHDPGVTLHYRNLARAAWDHVARQIMPIQVGDRVRFKDVGPYLDGREGRVSEVWSCISVDSDWEWHSGDFAPDKLTRIPAGESGEGATDE